MNTEPISTMNHSRLPKKIEDPKLLRATCPTRSRGQSFMKLAAEILLKKASQTAGFVRAGCPLATNHLSLHASRNLHTVNPPHAATRVLQM